MMIKNESCVLITFFMSITLISLINLGVVDSSWSTDIVCYS